MNQPDREFALHAIGTPLRKLIRQAYKADSCIASARIGMDLLERLEIPSYPLAVELLVFNEAFVLRFEREGRMPAGKEEVERWFAEDGAHSVGVGIKMENQPGRHMVLIVEDTYLWDLSADQASRPDKGIVIEHPILARVTPEFLAGTDPIHGRSDNGAVAIFRARPGYDCWTGTPNWDADGRDAPMRARMVEEAYQGIQEMARRITLGE